MKRFKMKAYLVLTLCLGAFLLTGCGGDWGDSNKNTAGATLSAIAVTPADPSIPSGVSVQFSAMGTYSDSSVADITASVTWSSATPASATMNISGMATGVAAGTSVITAALGTQSGFTTLTVTAATLNSIVVTPVDPTIINGLTQQFTATGTYSDSSEVDISASVIWSSGDTLVATLNPNGQVTSGLASGIGIGTALITATLDLSSADSLLTVSDPSLLPNNPQAPDLGETARFVILASQAITTTTAPKSAITNGDLGIMDQARSFYAGFTDGATAGQFTELTNGLSYAGDDTTPPYVIPVPYASMVAFINQSRTDLTVAYDFLAADPNPAAATQVSPIELGGLTLTRGVYKTASNVTIQTGSLTLDGQGDPNSVFIFTIDGNLTTDATAGAPAGNIVLIGNAQAKNVYWRTAGITALGTGTAFSGNVFAFPQVNVLTGTSVNGRLFSVTEQVTLDANAVTKPQ